MSKVEYSLPVSVRMQPEVVRLIDEAAAKQMTKPSEYLRRAVIAQLQTDGLLKA
jgi:hypothetical protein